MLKNYIALDLETTGFSPSSSDIIEIGAWKIKDGVVKEKFCTYVRPYVYIPRSVEQLTGITMDTVKDAPTIEEILFEFHSWCEDYAFVGHNISFDYSFLVEKGKNVGLDFTLEKMRKYVDTLKLSRSNLNLSSNKLEDLVNYFNISLENNKLHSASVDSYMVKLIIDRFNEILGNSSQLEPVLFDEIDKNYGKVTNMNTLSFE